MKTALTILTILIMQPVFAQDRSSSDVKKFCLTMELNDKQTQSVFKVKIKNGRKIIADRTVSGKKEGKKVTRIDRHSFQKFKNAVVNGGQFYTLPSAIHCNNCSPVSTVTLAIKTSAGNKTVSASNPHETNASVQFIIEMIKNMVGYVGNDFKSDGNKE